MIKNILFDLDDTLLDFTQAESMAIRRTYKDLGIPMTEEMYEKYHLINQRCWQEHERGELTREALLLARHQRMFQAYSLSLDPTDCERRYRKNLRDGHFLVPHALEILGYLKPRYRLFAASNGVADTQYPRIRDSGLAPYFEQVFLSEELGACKPTPAYFSRCFEKIPDFRREETLLIGDSLTSDIQGGMQAGLQTVWFHPQKTAAGADFSADREIADLLELKEFL